MYNGPDGRYFYASQMTRADSLTALILGSQPPEHNFHALKMAFYRYERERGARSLDNTHGAPKRDLAAVVGMAYRAFVRFVQREVVPYDSYGDWKKGKYFIPRMVFFVLFMEPS